MIIYAVLSIMVAAAGAESVASVQPLTVAERSDYQATARYDEVVHFIEQIAADSPVIRVGEMGKTVEGRAIPLIILADPPVSTPAEAADGGKMVVLAFGNIHAGEVCGKEALLMLARDLAQEPDRKLLEKLVIVFAPIFNADGNERVSKDNRPGQNGPVQGMGQRPNAQGLDLNRDYVKLESPEVRAMVLFLNEWDPAIIVDTHTTNGSYHRYTLTYEGPRLPAGDQAVIDYTRKTFFPAITKKLRDDHGYGSFYYGDFNRDHTSWMTYPCQARFGTPYRGLRNRLAVISEAYAYATFRDRVLASKAFVEVILQQAAENAVEIRDLLKSADQRTIESGEFDDASQSVEAGEFDDAGESESAGDMVAIRHRLEPFDAKVNIDGFVEIESDGEFTRTDEARQYEVDHVGQCAAELSVKRPFAYLLPPTHHDVIENLLRHGITVEELREDIELDVEIETLAHVERNERPFQGHHLVTVETTSSQESRKFPAGTIMVRTAQKLGALVVTLLEARSEDGLVTWNFFDDALAVGQEFPVNRLLKRVPTTSCDVRPLAETRASGRAVTFAEAYESDDPPDFDGSPIRGLTWLADGEHYLQVKDDGLWRVEAASGRVEPFHDPEKMAEALRSLPTIDAKTARKMAERTSFVMSDDRLATVINHENDLYYCRFDGSRADRLTHTPQEEELFDFSPDGQFVCFVRDHDLYVVDVSTQTERALTVGGDTRRRNGKLDWVYFEELYNRNWRGYWWSPDSRHVAFLHTDDTALLPFTVIDQMPLHQEVEVTPYPKAGDPNPNVSLGVVSAAGGSVMWINLDGYLEGAFLISRVGWKPDGESVWFYVQDRAQTWLDVNVASVTTGKPRQLFRETTDAWVSDPGDLTFLKDGSFIMASERTGWRHLYHYDADGQLIRPLTEGEWDVRSIQCLREEEGQLFAVGTRDSQIAENLYRLSLDGSPPLRLTAADGHHRTTVSPTGQHFLDTWSDPATPPQVRLFDGDGTMVRVVDSNPVYELEEFQVSAREFVRIPTRDGFQLEATLQMPTRFDPQRRYPVWFMTYGGPNSPTIRNEWNRSYAWDAVLAESGIIVFRCDPRSASSKGAASAWTAYRQLGVQELADINDAMDWLKEHPYVDASRIGMSGHSYGGFMTAYAMTHSQLFAAGIAGAPVTDWRNYDSIYTERYMNTPQENPDGYDRTSVVKAAKDLHGRLLILHGAKDDNVHLQNTLQLVHELQEADKPFEMMIYPQSRHGLHGQHYRRLMYEFIIRNVGGSFDSADSGSLLSN